MTTIEQLRANLQTLLNSTSTSLAETFAGDVLEGKLDLLLGEEPQRWIT